MSNYSVFKPKIPRFLALVCVVCIVCASLASFLCGCGAASVRTSFGLGAVLKLVAYEGMDEWYAYAQTLLVQTERLVDADDPNSDVARFNAAPVGEPVEVDRQVYEMLVLAKQAYDLCEGGYDPTAYWSVDLWGFSPKAQNTSSLLQRDIASLPADERVQAFASLCDLRAISLSQEGNAYTLCKSLSQTVDGTVYTVALDLGGIAKGWVVQRLLDKASQLGITKGYVSFGSSSVGLLANAKGKEWDLKLRHPRKDEGQTFCTIPTKNRALATSGDYENYFECNGTRYCHLIDPAQGRPIQNGVHSVTVLGQDAVLCDALATGLAVKGLAYIRSFAQGEAFDSLGLDVVVVYGEADALQCYSTLPSLVVQL